MCHFNSIVINAMISKHCFRYMRQFWKRIGMPLKASITIVNEYYLGVWSVWIHG